MSSYSVSGVPRRAPPLQGMPQRRHVRAPLPQRECDRHSLEIRENTAPQRCRQRGVIAPPGQQRETPGEQQHTEQLGAPAVVARLAGEAQPVEEVTGDLEGEEESEEPGPPRERLRTEPPGADGDGEIEEG